MNKVSASNG